MCYKYLSFTSLTHRRLIMKRGLVNGLLAFERELNGTLRSPRGRRQEVTKMVEKLPPKPLKTTFFTFEDGKLTKIKAK